MAMEGLELEVVSKLNGWEVVKPPVIRGRSGVSHRFSLLATTRGVSYGVDSFSEVGGIEVLKTFIKKIDTGVNSVIVRGAASASEEAERLAKEYGITILGRDELGGFFEQMDVNTLISQSSGRWPRS